MAATRTGMLLKTITPNVLSRAVTAPAATQHTTSNTIILDRATPSTCPFRSALQTVDDAISPWRQQTEHPIATTEQHISTTTTTTVTKAKSFESIPGPKGLPVVGTLFDYMKKDGLKFNKMFEAYQKRAIDHGPIYKEKIATISTVVISDPEEYSKVIHSEGKYPQRREMEPIAYYRQQKGLGLGLVNDQGEEWYKLRTVTAPKMLKMTEALNFCVPMSEVGNDFVSHLKSVRHNNDEVVGLEKELFKWAFESIGTFLFEERVGCFSNPAPTQAKEFIDHLQEFFRYLQPLMYNVPIYKLYRTKLWNKFEQHADKVFELGRYFIEKSVAELETSQASGEDGDSDKVPFLTYLLSQSSLTTDEAVSTAVDLLTAATETTSNAMLWSLYCLAENPDVQERLYQETKDILGDSIDINPENITKLTYVKAVIKETFRKFPITWATSRITQEDMEISGHHIPANTHVQANLFGMFRDEKFFPDNDQFKPERWLRENKMDSQLKKLSNLIWGHGARMCIGRRFAEQEMHIMLTKIVQNFKLEYHHEPIEPTLNTVMTPDRPLVLKFIPRS